MTDVFQGLPLEEVAAIFGDADEVALYQRDLEIDTTTHEIKTHGFSASRQGSVGAKAGQQEIEKGIDHDISSKES